MKEEKMQKSQGFEGELIIEIPQIAVKNCEKIPLIRSMFISRMGYYPKALNHYYERPTGISQVIFIYCTDGEGWVQLQREKIKIKAGEIIIIPKNKSHSYGADTKNPWSIYWFHFSGMQSDEVYEAIMVNKVDVEAIQVGFWEERNSLFQQIASIFLKGYSPTNLLLANLTLRYYLATFISFEYFQKNENSFQKISPTDQAILYMQKNLSSTLTLDNIAQSANLSTSFFSRKFKQDTGYAPIEYFNHLRIQKACQLLHFSELRINEVASEIGIDDPFYFSRLFKQQMGVSPVKYRKQV